jgi:hypothetical protein
MITTYYFVCSIHLHHAAKRSRSLQWDAQQSKVGHHSTDGEAICTFCCPLPASVNEWIFKNGMNGQ